ncbi:Rid family hydrolase [Streptomyces sp. NPDC002680]|uniref:Rid family hydrolase n=1 Tax=Streptomyces sp. NPDC002680 TaxID=3364659 RepID=UPI0036BBEF58
MTTQSFSFDIGAEQVFGYSQAVKVGDTIYVAGQLSYDEDGTFLHAGDFEAQAKQSFANLDKVLANFGATRRQIVQDTVFVVNLSQYVDALAAAHVGYFGDHRPATTGLSVGGLVFPGQLFEINVVVDLRADA